MIIIIIIIIIIMINIVPPNFDQELHQLVNKGYRVIAVGYKTLGNVKFHKLTKIDR